MSVTALKRSQLLFVFYHIDKDFELLVSGLKYSASSSVAGFLPKATNIVISYQSDNLSACLSLTRM